MDKAFKEYIAGLKPTGLPDWKEILNKGVELGKATPTKMSRFIEESKYTTYHDRCSVPDWYPKWIDC